MIKRVIKQIAVIETASNNKLAMFGFSFLPGRAIAAGAMHYALDKH